MISQTTQKPEGAPQEVKENPTPATPKNEVAYSQQVKRSKSFQEYSLNSTISTKTLKDQLEGFVNDHKPLDLDALLQSVKSLITDRKSVV